MIFLYTVLFIAVIVLSHLIALIILRTIAICRLIHDKYPEVKE